MRDVLVHTKKWLSSWILLCDKYPVEQPALQRQIRKRMDGGRSRWKRRAPLGSFDFRGGLMICIFRWFDVRLVLSLPTSSRWAKSKRESADLWQHRISSEHIHIECADNFHGHGKCPQGNNMCIYNKEA